MPAYLFFFPSLIRHYAPYVLTTGLKKSTQASLYLSITIIIIKHALGNTFVVCNYICMYVYSDCLGNKLTFIKNYAHITPVVEKEVSVFWVDLVDIICKIQK